MSESRTIQAEGDLAALVRTRAALASQDESRRGNPSDGFVSGVATPIARRKPRKPEDTSEGCRARAGDDLSRASGADSAHMRQRLEKSALAWTMRADMILRHEKSRLAAERSVQTDIDA